MNIPKSKAVEKLRAIADRGKSLQASATSDPAFKKWCNDCEAALRNIFGVDSTHLKEFTTVSYSPIVLSIYGDNTQAFASAYHAGMSSALSLMRAYADEVLEYWDDDNAASIAPHAIVSQLRTIFIIHGRDTNFAESVARFIEKRGLKAVILHEQPNMGRTVIEKFEAHAAPCEFAIALFTPDDEGRLKVDGESIRPRARQNVLLETGYFVGALSRSRVAIIHSKDVELPSDFGGLLYIPIDNWRDKLSQELDSISSPKSGF